MLRKVLLSCIVFFVPLWASLWAEDLKRVVVDGDKSHFVVEHTDTRFIPWGFNYLGVHGHLAEEEWQTDAGWKKVETDFREMKKLGANVVRWHLQVPTYLKGPKEADEEQLARLVKLLDLAGEVGVYLDLTGLNCYRLANSPKWYDELSEKERWEVQAFFWETIAKTCAGRPEVFCYDLMNEPVIVAAKPGEHPWLGGELGGFHFVQRLIRDPAGREQVDVAKAWSEMMVAAIRTHDQKTLVTVGVIPWAFVWPTAKPVFYAPEVKGNFDFVSIHVYPTSGKQDADLKALDAYRVGLPLVIEETFPLSCSQEEFEAYLVKAGPKVNGWVSHYFGATIEEHRAGAEPAGALVARFLEYWAGVKPEAVTVE